jgi:predicted Zn-dependent protease with MMP-like domain
MDDEHADGRAVPPADDPGDPFEALVANALAELPAPFRDALTSVAVVVEDEPSSAQLASVGAARLYGLYQGVPRTVYGASLAPIPSRITIFRGPLTRAHRDPARLAGAVRETVRHEIAHHLGISDARLRELGA